MDDLENRVVLEIKNLSFSYPDGEELLSGLNFRLVQEYGARTGPVKLHFLKSSPVY